MGGSQSKETERLVRPSDLFFSQTETETTGSIIMLTKRLEHDLRVKFGGRGRGLGEVLNTVEKKLAVHSPDLPRRIRALNEFRNKATHEVGYAASENICMVTFRLEYEWCLGEIRGIHRYLNAEDQPSATNGGGGGSGAGRYQPQPRGFGSQYQGSAFQPRPSRDVSLGRDGGDAKKGRLSKLVGRISGVVDGMKTAAQSAATPARQVVRGGSGVMRPQEEYDYAYDQTCLEFAWSLIVSVISFVWESPRQIARVLALGLFLFVIWEVHYYNAPSTATLCGFIACIMPLAQEKYQGKVPPPPKQRLPNNQQHPNQYGTMQQGEVLDRNGNTASLPPYPGDRIARRSDPFGTFGDQQRYSHHHHPSMPNQQPSQNPPQGQWQRQPPGQPRFSNQDYRQDRAMSASRGEPAAQRWGFRSDDPLVSSSSDGTDAMRAFRDPVGGPSSGLGGPAPHRGLPPLSSRLPPVSEPPVTGFGGGGVPPLGPSGAARANVRNMSPFSAAHIGNGGDLSAIDNAVGGPRGSRAGVAGFMTGPSDFNQQRGAGAGSNYNQQPPRGLSPYPSTSTNGFTGFNAHDEKPAGVSKRQRGDDAPIFDSRPPSMSRSPAPGLPSAPLGAPARDSAPRRALSSGWGHMDDFNGLPFTGGLAAGSAGAGGGIPQRAVDPYDAIDPFEALAAERDQRKQQQQQGLGGYRSRVPSPREPVGARSW